MDPSEPILNTSIGASWPFEGAGRIGAGQRYGGVESWSRVQRHEGRLVD
jgi:hypothetical protein